MMNYPLVSILIPAFNAGEWLADSLKSAIAQTWPNKEIIVVDDGSKDGTLAIAQQLASSEVIVLSQKNQGAAAARNAAFAASKGAYIQWLDADDLLAPDKIASQMAVAQQCPSRRTLLSSGWGRFMYRCSRAAFVPTALWCDLTPADWLFRKMSLNLHMQTATWLVTRELTEAAGPWNTKLLGDDDGEYFCRILLQSDGVRFVPDARVFYRMAGSSSLSYIGQSSSKMEAQLRSMRLHIGYLRSLEESERTRAACVQYLQNWVGNFYPEREDLVAEIQEMARELGGQVVPAPLSWKYSWMRGLVGEMRAKHAQVRLRHIRWSVARLWDKALYRKEDLAI
jgi:glycosyltransferase involved in cell wall biosynthesis